MGRKGRETTKEERQVAINMFCRGYGFAEIASAMIKPLSTVKGIIYRYGKDARVANNPRSGRPKKLSATEERFVVRQIRKDPFLSAPKLAARVANMKGEPVSSDTIRKTLRHQGFHGRVARKKPFISKLNFKKRLQYAKDNVAHPADYWNRVIFTDESKFNIHKSDGRSRVWRQANKELDKKNLIGTVKHGGGSVMVWGCMSASGVGKLKIIDGIMDHTMYINILKENLAPSVEKMGLQDGYIFTQDNDPKHTALNTRLWLLYNTPKYMPTPPQSPDLNPIEHLWQYLDVEIRKRDIRSLIDLKSALLEEWEKIPETVTRNLVESMGRRLSAVIEQKGGPTKY